MSSECLQSVFRVCSECVESVFRVCSVLKSFHRLAHLVCQFLAFLVGAQKTRFFDHFCYLNTSNNESDYIIFTPNFSVLHSFCAFPIGPRQNGNGLSVLGQLLCQCQSRHLALFSIKLCYIVVLNCCIISVRGNFGISMWHINSER